MQRRLSVACSRRLSWQISGNSIRGFGHGIVATDKDRVVVRGNDIDVSHSPTADGVTVSAGVARAVVSGNTVSGAASARNCVDCDGCVSGAPDTDSAVPTRRAFDNECW